MDSHDKVPFDLAAVSEEAGKIDAAAAAKEILVWLRDNVETYVDNERTDYNVVFNTIAVQESSPFQELRRLEDLFSRVFAITGPGVLSESSEDPAESAAAATFKRLMSGETISEKDHDNLQEVWGRLGDDGSNPSGGSGQEEADSQVALESEGLQLLYPVLDAVLLEMQRPSPALDEAASKLAYYYELKGWKSGAPVVQKLSSTIDFMHLEYSPDPVILAKKHFEEVLQPDGTKDRRLVEVTFRLGCAGGFMVSFNLVTRPEDTPTSLF